MPFSQQSYTGQGIVQQNVTPRAGEIIGASLANMGQSIGAGIEKFTQRRQEAKELRGELTKLAQFVPKEEKDEFLAQVETGSLGDLKGLQRGIYQQAALKSMQLEQAAQEERIATSQQARAQNDQLANFLGGYMQASQPQSVDVSKTDYSQQIQEQERNIGLLESMLPKHGPRPAGAMSPANSLARVAAQREPDMSDPYTQMVSESLRGKSNLTPAQSLMAKEAGLNVTPYTKAMASKAKQAASALDQVDKFESGIQDQLSGFRSELGKWQELQAIESSKPDSVPEPPEKTTERLSQFMADALKKYPAAAPLIAKQMFADPKEPKALTAEEQKSMGYAMRMQSAERELGRILKDFKPEGAGQSIAKMLPNLMKSDNRQQYETVAMDWITAVLRRESGAAIGKDEFQRDFKKYFPQPGDSEGTVNLKAKRRQEAVNSITAPMGLGGFGSASIQPRMRYNPSTGKVE